MSETSDPLQAHKPTYIWYELHGESESAARRIALLAGSPEVHLQEMTRLSDVLGQAGKDAVLIRAGDNPEKVQAGFYFPKVFLSYTNRVFMASPVGKMLSPNGKIYQEGAHFVPKDGIVMGPEFNGDAQKALYKPFVERHPIFSFDRENNPLVPEGPL